MLNKPCHMHYTYVDRKKCQDMQWKIVGHSLSCKKLLDSSKPK
jgi:hypothetical protein